MKTYDVIILGGGAAGLMCAATAGQRGRSVLVLEGSNKIGKKILMSGGGRCNFTNLHCGPADFLSANPHFCKSALSRYTQWDFISLVQKHGISYHEKTLGQLFCDDSSKEILAALKSECDSAGVEIRTDSAVKSVSHEAGYAVTTSLGTFHCQSLVIATGGLSIPKMGATDFGYRLARQFGLKVNETRAALVPFTFSGSTLEMAQRLAGVSLRAVLSTGNKRFTENILFTHRGLSGPAALQLSSYWQLGDEIILNLLPELNVSDRLLELKKQRSKSLLRTCLSDLLPRALILELEVLHWPGFADTPILQISDERLRQVGGLLNGWRLKPSGTEGYRTAEVTLGGIDTNELSSQTLECKKQPGLYCIGEVVDVTGHLGGFNFQWAWASGYAAGGTV